MKKNAHKKAASSEHSKRVKPHEKSSSKAESIITEKLDRASESALASTDNPNKDAIAEALDQDQKVSVEQNSLKVHSRREEVDQGQATPDREQHVNDQNDLPKIEKRNKKLLFLGGFAFVIIATSTVAVGLFIFSSLKDSQVAAVEQESVVVQTPTTVVPELSLDRGEWNFEILNGSGVAGAAGSAAERLEELGYTVTTIGNSEDNVEVTEIYLVEGTSNKDKDLLIQDLEKVLGELNHAGILEDSEADVKIVLGSS